MPSEATAEAIPPDDDVVVPDFIDLPRGKEMNEDAAIAFASSKPVRLVVIAGQVKGGKTTLLTTLYEMFQAGPILGQNFAGSVTLAGLEERCHAARLASQNPTAETIRTTYKGAHPFYLHLKTSPALQPADPTDFLFTDVSGEMFEHAIDTAKECKELTFLRRANHFVLLLDGEKAVRDDKWSMIRNARTLLQSCLDCEMLPNFCAVSVVWSKFDYFEAATPADKAANANFRENVERDFKQLFAHRVHSLKFDQIAARPRRAPVLGFGFGVAALYADWLAVSPRSRQTDLMPIRPAGTRESELFSLRNPPAPVP